MYLAGYTNEEIAEDMNISVQPVKDVTTDIFTKLEKNPKNLANFQDNEFEVPIYNVWAFIVFR